MNLNEYISINPKVCNGKPVLAGTRIPLTVLLDQLATGCSIQDLLCKYPELSIAQIKTVIEQMQENDDLRQKAIAFGSNLRTFSLNWSKNKLTREEMNAR